MKKVLIIGATGLVGSRFVELAKRGLDIVAIDEKVLDITDNNSVNKYFDQNKFNSIINFAAITNVDGAEKERGDENGNVWKLNVVGVKNLSNVCKERDIFFVQISTDFVYGGSKLDPGPYSEDKKIPDNNDGISWYGWTKNRAEKILSKSGARYAIVRIAYPFYASNFEGKLDFAKGFMKLYDQNKLYPIFSDQILSVLNVDCLLDPLQKIVKDEIQGTFHVVSSDTTTPFNFVSYLLEKTRDVRDVLQKGSIEEFIKTPGKTPRSVLGGLKTEITEKKLSIKFKTWREMVDDFVSKL